jgi:hypothetical protein
VAERFAVPPKPGNAGGGKESQFKIDAKRSEGPGEADLPSEVYAYRRGRNAQQAVLEVEERLFRGHPEVVDADLADYFGNIPKPLPSPAETGTTRPGAGPKR